MSILFQDNFDKYTPGEPPPFPPWTVLFGTWMVEDGVLSQNDEAVHAHIRAGDPAWKDYTVEADVTLISGAVGGGGGIIARAKRVDAKEVGYALVLYRNILKLYDVDGWVTLTSASVSVSPLERHRLKLEVKGNSIRGWLDDELKIKATDEKYVEGCFDLFTSSQHCHFDNVMVSTIPTWEWIPLIVGGLAPLLFDLAVIVASELTKPRW